MNQCSFQRRRSTALLTASQIQRKRNFVTSRLVGGGSDWADSLSSGSQCFSDSRKLSSHRSNSSSLPASSSEILRCLELLLRDSERPSVTENERCKIRLGSSFAAKVLSRVSNTGLFLYI